MSLSWKRGPGRGDKEFASLSGFEAIVWDEDGLVRVMVDCDFGSREAAKDFASHCLSKADNLGRSDRSTRLTLVEE